MKHKTKICSEQGYPLQARRKYKVTPLDHWVDNYNEEIELMGISRGGRATVLVTTGSALLGDQVVKVPANLYTWIEI